MQIFLSHSGERSRKLAEFLRTWLKDVNPAFGKIWIDRDSIPPGQPWRPELDRALADSQAGIICTTPENAAEPWLIAEFVCLAKDGKPAIPFLVGGATPEHLTGPMQAVGYTFPKRDETWNLLKQLVDASEQQDSLAEVETRFNRHWPELENHIKGLGQNPITQMEVKNISPGTMPSVDEMIRKTVGEVGTVGILVRLVRNSPALVMILLGFMGLSAIAAFVPKVRDWAAAAISPTARELMRKNIPPPTPPTPPIPPRDSALNLATEDLNKQLAAQTETIRALRESNDKLAMDKSDIEKRNSALASEVQRLGQKVQAPPAPGPDQRDVRAFLPPEDVNVRSIMPSRELSALPKVDEWLLFLPRDPTTRVDLFADSTPGKPAGSLEFGIPYQVVSVLDDARIQVRAGKPDKALETKWIHGWKQNPNYITLRLPESGLKIPGWRFFRSPEPTPAPNLPLAGQEVFSLAQAVINAPFVVNGNAISQSVETLDPRQGGRMELKFTVEKPGSYLVIAEVNAPSDKANSFFVSIDGEPVSEMIWRIPVTSGFESKPVTWGGSATPQVWNLSAGQHVLVIRGRAAATRLGKVTIFRRLAAPKNYRAK